MSKLIIYVLLGVSILLASCGQGGNTVEPGGDQDQSPGQETPSAPVKVIGTGFIIKKEDSRWLVTTYVEKNGTPYIDAFWLTVNEKTVLQDSEGRDVQPQQMAVGMQVEAWSAGAIRESYPGQTDASKIVMYADKQTVPEGVVGQADAVRAALQSQAGTTAARSVKAASLDEENGYWKIELVQHENIDQPVTIRIN